MVRLNLKDRFLYGDLGDDFLELFEQEVKKFKLISFQNIITNPSSIFNLLSLSNQNKSSNKEEIDDIKKAIQQFLLIRELKYSIKRKKDELIPFKERNDNNDNIKIELECLISIEGKAIEECEIVSRRGFGSRFLLIESPYLIVGEPIRGSRNVKVQEMLDLQHLEVLLPFPLLSLFNLLIYLLLILFFLFIFILFILFYFLFILLFYYFY